MKSNIAKWGIDFIASILMGLTASSTFFLTLVAAALFDGWKEFLFPICIFVIGGTIYIFIGRFRKN